MMLEKQTDKIFMPFLRMAFLSLVVMCLVSLVGCNNEKANVERADNEARKSELESSEPGSNQSKNKDSVTKDLAYRQTGIDGAIPSAVQRAGDASVGAQALITEPIVSCGLPLTLLKQLEVDAPFTLPSRKGIAASLPYNLNLIEDANGVQLAASNCLTCHATPLFGKLVIGLGNEFLDFTVNPSIAVEQAGALVTNLHEIAAWEKFADRVATIAPYIQTETVGVNPANNLTFALMSHRDAKTMGWLDAPRIAPPPRHVPPVSVPPWWRMKKKHAMFSMGEGRGDHASFMMTAAILCADSLQEIKQLDKIAPDIRAYIASLEPPKYPFAVDSTLAQTGKTVFESTCSTCHGTYGEQSTYPNKLVDIDIIGTDSSLIDFAFSDGSVFVDWFNESPFGELAKASPSRGYVAPPLDGIWSTAPFLHNGSVPTIRAVLDSASRPKIWQHRDRSSASEASYNQRDLGWYFRGPTDSVDDTTNRWLYDTSKLGYANHGHQFGDGLSADQRDAVIEYLKTL